MEEGGNTGRCQLEVSRMAGAQTAADLNKIIRKCSDAGMKKPSSYQRSRSLLVGLYCVSYFCRVFGSFVAYEDSGRTYCGIPICDRFNA